MTRATKLHQGDSYAIPLVLTQDGIPLTADLVQEIQLTVGGILHRSLGAGDLLLTDRPGRYCFIPTQAETLSMAPGTYDVAVRVKYRDSIPWVDVESVGRITILPGIFREEI